MTETKNKRIVGMKKISVSTSCLMFSFLEDVVALVVDFGGNLWTTKVNGTKRQKPCPTSNSMVLKTNQNQIIEVNIPA